MSVLPLISTNQKPFLNSTGHEYIPVFVLRDAPWGVLFVFEQTPRNIYLKNPEPISKLERGVQNYTDITRK